MPDADWVKYKKLRGRPLPDVVSHEGAIYERESVLKYDFYAAVGLYRVQPETALQAKTHQQVLVKVYHTDRLGPMPLGWLGRWLCRREVGYLARLADVEGAPGFLARMGEAGMIRPFLPGWNLREYVRQGNRPDEHFFPRLTEALAKVHARDVSHNDLSKPENVLVLRDGSPCLIDFQIAMGPAPFTWPIVGRALRPILRYMQSVDRYHLMKLHRRNRPGDFSTIQIEHAKRKGVLLNLHGTLIRRPYRAVRHLVLDRWMTAEPVSEAVEPSTRRAA